MNIQPLQFQNLILNWFDEHGRKHLPWQKNKTAYRVWISEIMLQQTQVNTVIPYYEKFIKKFSKIKMLANANEDDVLHLWAGLGYYSRARNLHKAAKMIMQEFNGKFPSDSEALQKLPGIGKSTAAAILSIAFNQNTAILDGNVKRVLARFQGITEPINEKNIEKKLWNLAENLMPIKRCADYTQAIMDLGATICMRGKPLCNACPLVSHCVAHQQNIAAILPRKKSKKLLPTHSATFLILQNKNKILLCKRPSIGIWGGLWSFPEIKNQVDEENIRDYCYQHFHLHVSDFKFLNSFRHTFSHYHLNIFPVIIPVKRLPIKINEDNQQIWFQLNQPQNVGLPKPIQFIINEFLL